MSTGALARIDALRTIGRLPEAERVAREALHTAPENAELLLQLSDVVRRQGRHAEALQIADGAVRSAPMLWQPYAQRALALSGLQRHLEACQAAAYCLQLSPHDSHALLVFAAVHHGAQQYPTAYGAAREAALLSPESPTAHLMVGVSAAGCGDRSTARRAYEEALRLDPQNASARHDIALLDLQSGRTGRAIDGFLAAGAMAPTADLPLIENIAATMWRLSVHVRWVLLASYLAISFTTSTADEAISSRIVAGVALVLSAVLTYTFTRKLPPQALRVGRLALLADRLLTATAVLSAAGLLMILAVIITGIPELAAIILVLMLVGLVLNVIRGRQRSKELRRS